MLSYQVLCQHIADWKAGQRPTSAPRPVPRATPHEVHELDSGMVTLDDPDLSADEEGTRFEAASSEESSEVEPEPESAPADDEEEIPID